MCNRFYLSRKQNKHTFQGNRIGELPGSSKLYLSNQKQQLLAASSKSKSKSKSHRVDFGTDFDTDLDFDLEILKYLRHTQRFPA